mgnify:CR=1 FL=1
MHPADAQHDPDVTVDVVALVSLPIDVVPSPDSISTLTEAELESLIVANDAQLRRREVLQALAVAEFGRRGGYLRDGHRSIAAWGRGQDRKSTRLNSSH